MPEWLKVILFIFVLYGAGFLLMLAWVLLVGFWEKGLADKGHLGGAAQAALGICYLILFYFLAAASWYEVRYLWFHTRTSFWVLSSVLALLVARWWPLIMGYGQTQKEKDEESRKQAIQAHIQANIDWQKAVEREEYKAYLADPDRPDQ